MQIVWFYTLLALRGGDPFEIISVFFDKSNTEMELPLLSCHFIDKNPRIPYIPVNDTADTNILIQNTVVQLLHTLCNVKLNKDIGLLSSFGKYSLMAFKRGTFLHIPLTKLECVIRPSATAIFAISFSVGDRVTPLKFRDRCVMTMLVRVAANCLV